MAVIKWFATVQDLIRTSASTALLMPVTGITGATRPAYVIPVEAAVTTIAVPVDVDMDTVTIMVAVMDMVVDMIVGNDRVCYKNV
ncbi:hypothetical protein A4R26_19665 [Niastella populi]|uniref:Uncharacterized protein n=1 Tax=Niastella populi TaxID=550983 RepID=A0A1V9FRB2_9BACT|nr:hypothetical protein A4R26_19665 [Niastella populi]